MCLGCSAESKMEQWLPLQSRNSNAARCATRWVFEVAFVFKLNQTWRRWAPQTWEWAVRRKTETERHTTKLIVPFINSQKHEILHFYSHCETILNIFSRAHTKRLLFVVKVCLSQNRSHKRKHLQKQYKNLNMCREDIRETVSQTDKNNIF